MKLDRFSKVIFSKDILIFENMKIIKKQFIKDGNSRDIEDIEIRSLDFLFIKERIRFLSTELKIPINLFDDFDYRSKQIYLDYNIKTIKSSYDV